MSAVDATRAFAFRGRMSFDKPPRNTPSEEARIVGEAIRLLRERRDIKQADAAAAAGVSRTAWQNYEGGRTIVLRTDMQARLAEALGAQREDLLRIIRQLQSHGGAAHSAIGQTESASIHAGPGRQTAVFPLAEGDVVMIYPSELSAKGYQELSEYLALFLRRSAS